ncbi:MAG: UbiX family flavin prenyltransferase [Gammaproteobacteria bacterium]|jgi:4-hydroxy-3-polyprenylbenzoate decarboxylase|nr:UbiX family flavin prenyltransferase [Gammaproteobacteria bacterium]MBT3488247.1 UbiX family flavin prenyltransferase [Gammaproteobacteria bacterium]MBT3719924.1 UbiX family flavin prenyltransferase [Gammaproteobacteria bacterium]MBT3843840.1 UbiX family flavin prenyltransferase [Gammaproteobacteria bacterium]MBT3894234.1 UbiX family flavin prenyltransferase [Gammaproteobacteria bacterium]
MSWNRQNTIALAVTGASGSAYALRLLQQLLAAEQRVWMMLSDAARIVMEMEVGISLPESIEEAEVELAKRYGAKQGQLSLYGRNDWMAPVASGSAVPRAMVVCPCSMGTLSAIAHGGSDNLLERAADVMIKERRQLLLVPRETPYSTIHLENMLKLSQIGVTMLPANPGLYQQPESIGDLIDFVVARILDQLEIEQQLLPRWGV